jgi:hypothetical protein
MSQSDRLEQATRAIEGLATVLANDATRKRSWLERYPTWGVFLAGVVIVLTQFVAQRYLQDNVTKAMEPIQKATNKKIQTFEQDAAKAQTNNATEHLMLRQNGADLATYMIEGDRYDRAMLESVAGKLRVKPKKRPDALDEAEKRVRQVRDRARVKIK